ncbi:MAG: flagellar biosynthetic protein FliQ [Planctomycetes bacterium]|nr:flagellar biosynthetic protein FliQ [Planctomycetota bacterium]
MPFESTQVAVDLAREALFLAARLSLPLLGAGLVVGFVASVFQAATQIQDPSLSFVPKAVAVGVTFLATLPWLLAQLGDYATAIFRSLAGLLAG